jgi:hypothetical protein
LDYNQNSLPFQIIWVNLTAKIIRSSLLIFSTEFFLFTKIFLFNRLLINIICLDSIVLFINL